MVGEIVHGTGDVLADRRDLAADPKRKRAEDGFPRPRLATSAHKRDDRDDQLQDHYNGLHLDRVDRSHVNLPVGEEPNRPTSLSARDEVHISRRTTISGGECRTHN